MTCPRCGGCVFPGWLEDTTVGVVAKVDRCVNCGWYGRELRGYYGYFKQARALAAGVAAVPTKRRPRTCAAVVDDAGAA